jgi:toxin ParE1/3/4
MRLVFSPYVESDLDEIAAYIAADNPVRAVSFIDEIAAHLNVIAENPRLYRLRPEIGPEARLAAHGRYVILFRLLPDCVRIERVVHGARRLPDLLMREDAGKGS